MSYQVLARKWRPKSFSEVIGQDHVVRSLQNTLNSKRIAHAYLFTGTRGVGKTTLARLFGKALMCETPLEDSSPCTKCNSCIEADSSSSLNYIEIDGASNNSVENIRELIENAHYLPTNGKYKIFVIDEVHMLSVSAFNALLKILEEPPAHVVFIFATTDPQKLLGTVLSRCQRFDFKNVSVAIIEEHLKKILSAEKINYESDKILSELAKFAKGSIRDSLSLLDQTISLGNGEVTQDALNFSLGLAAQGLLKDLFSSLLVGNSKELVVAYKNILKSNIDFKSFASQVLDSLFEIIESLDDKGFSKQSDFVDTKSLEGLSYAELFWIYETLSKDFDFALKSHDPEKNLEFTLLKVCLRHNLIDDKKKIKFSSKVTEKKIVKNWETFSNWLFENEKALAVNLERGNLLNDLNLQNSELFLKIAFSEENKIFYDFLNEHETVTKLKKSFAAYFDKDVESLKINLELLDETEKSNMKFMSKFEKDKEAENQAKEKKVNDILTNKYVEEAKKLFNTDVAKIVLNDQGDN